MWYKLKRIMMRPNGVEKQVRPSGWEPWANTVAYYPLTSQTTVNDMSGNNYTLINNGLSFGTYNGVSCAYKEGWILGAYSNITNNPNWNSDRTYSFWSYNENITIPGDIECYISTGNRGSNQLVVLGASESSNGQEMVSQRWQSKYMGASLRGQWVYTCVTYDGATFYWYRNWVLLNTWSYVINTTWTTFAIGGYPNWGRYTFRWNFSNLILENKARTAQEVADYYNLTKSNYWL